MHRRTALFSTILFFAGTVFCSGADKPNFSGMWKLDADKSVFGPMPPPTSVTMKVEHNDPLLKMLVNTVGGMQGDSILDAKYTTDGKECINKLQGQELKSKVVWDNGSLVMTTKIDFGGMASTVTSKWSLIAEGKVLINTSHIELGPRAIDTTYVFNKQ